jgi:hypothetical protein
MFNPRSIIIALVLALFIMPVAAAPFEGPKEDACAQRFKDPVGSKSDHLTPSEDA